MCGARCQASGGSDEGRQVKGSARTHLLAALADGVEGLVEPRELLGAGVLVVAARLGLRVELHAPNPEEEDEDERVSVPPATSQHQ